MSDIRINSDEARRLKNDTAFKRFVQDVRDMQVSIFANSEAHQVEQREEAHAVMRALTQIEMQLDAAIAAERILDHSK